MERRPSYLAAFGWIVAGVTGAVLAAVVVHALALRPTEFVASSAAAAVLALVFARRPAEGIGAFLLFLLFADNWEYWLGLDLRLADEGTVVLFGTVGLLRRYLPSRRLRFGLKEAALAVVLAAGIASSLIADVPLTVWGPATILLFKAIAFFYLVSWLSLTIEDVERVGLVIGLVALVIAGLGFVEFLDPPGFQQFFGLPHFVDERGDISVTKSLFLHPALYGWLTVFTSLFLYARFIVMGSWWALPMAVLLTVATVISTRRTPLIGLAMALTTGLVWQLRRRPTLRVLLLVWTPLAAAVVALAVIFRPALAEIYTVTAEEYVAPPIVVQEIFSPDPDPEIISTAHPRVALYLGSVAVARDRFPLGAGFGRFGSHMSGEEYSPLYAQYGLERVPGLQPSNLGAVTDTFWPMVLGEAGGIGLIGMAAFIGLVLVELVKAASRAETMPSRAFSLGALLIFVESVVGSLTAATYVAPPIAYFVFTVSGAALALVAGEALAPKGSMDPRRAQSQAGDGSDIGPADNGM